MKCPNCNETLLMSDKNGIEVDYCPNCRGIWLDRGELDKIIERSAAHYSVKENYDRDQSGMLSASISGPSLTTRKKNPFLVISSIFNVPEPDS